MCSKPRSLLAGGVQKGAMDTGTRGMHSSVNPLDLLVDGQLALPVIAHTGEGVFGSLFGCAGVLHMSQLSGDLHSHVVTQVLATGGLTPKFWEYRGFCCLYLSNWVKA